MVEKHWPLRNFNNGTCCSRVRQKRYEMRALVYSFLRPGLPSRPSARLLQAAAVFIRCSFLCLPLRLKCHRGSGWRYFLSCYNLQETKQMVNLSLWLLCFMGDLVWKMTEPHTGTLIEGKRGVCNIHKAFMSQENCDHRFTRHGTSWWVTLHPVVNRHFVAAALSELKLLWSWLTPWETPIGSGV